MRRKTIEFINKRLGQLIVLEKIPKVKDRRIWVRCKCLVCGREDFKTRLNNIKEKEYKSCGCLQYTFQKDKSPKWMGYGEISKSFFNKIRDRAIAANLNFSLTIEYLWRLFLKQNRKCALTGEEICFPKRLRDFSQTASLDRIDSTKGYTSENVQWVSKNINYMKMDLSQDEFFKYCKKIVEYNCL